MCPRKVASLPILRRNLWILFILFMFFITTILTFLGSTTTLNIYMSVCVCVFPYMHKNEGAKTLQATITT